MDIKGMQYFVAAAECLNFTHAAQQCFITQTAMSLHIAKMEEELGIQLFSRSNRLVELTAAGKVFYERALHIIKQYDDAVQQSLNTAAGFSGNIAIMLPSCIEGLILIDELRLFRSIYPGIDFHVQVIEPKNMYEKLKNKESDVAICWPADFNDKDGLEIIPFRQYSTVVCLAVDHPLAKQPKITPAQIRQERAVILEPRGNPKSYRNMRNSWVERGLEPASVIKVNRLEEILLMIELGLGIGLLPTYVYDYTRGPARSEVQFVEIETDGPPPMQELSIIHWKNNNNPALANLLAVFEQSNTMQA